MIGSAAWVLELHTVDERRRIFRSVAFVDDVTDDEEAVDVDDVPAVTDGGLTALPGKTTSPPISFTRRFTLSALSKHIFHRASASFLPPETPAAGGGRPLARRLLHRCAASRYAGKIRVERMVTVGDGERFDSRRRERDVAA